MMHPHILRQIEVLLSSSDDQHHGHQTKVEDVENTKLTVNNLINLEKRIRRLIHALLRQTMQHGTK